MTTPNLNNNNSTNVPVHTSPLQSPLNISSTLETCASASSISVLSNSSTPPPPHLSTNIDHNTMTPASVQGTAAQPSPLPLNMANKCELLNSNPISPPGLISGTKVGGKQPKGPMCILTPCSNSHPFDERRILLTRTEESNAIKIGRSVVRLQPSSSNAIFDCKVLSRNHAILWLNNEGHFMIKDMRSSNGTFINNERLSASGEESPPKELFSGDILQLGVEIVDNAKKVASGCVTCIVRLTNERGEECAGRPQGDPFSQYPIRSEQQIPLNYTLIRNDKFFILDQYIKEAKFRENLLGQKLQLLEEQLLAAQETLQGKWEEQINQELLLSRIELLESQLVLFTSKKAAASATGEDEERLMQEMHQLMEDRAKAEQLAKESLRTKFEQMQETSMRLHDAEMSLINVEEECAFLRQRCADFEDHQNRQRGDYDALLAKYNEICAQLSAAEKACALAANTTDQQPQINGIVEQPQMVGKEEQQNNNVVSDTLNNKIEIGQEVTNTTSGDIKWIEVPPPLPSTEQVFASDHQCRESELKNLLAEFEAELGHQRDRYNSLMDRFNESERKMEQMKVQQQRTGSAVSTIEGMTGNAPLAATGSSPADFQMFLLSTCPFLLLFILCMSPFFYFFGSSWLTGPVDGALTTNDSGQERNDEGSGQNGPDIKQGDQ